VSISNASLMFSGGDNPWQSPAYSVSAEQQNPMLWAVAINFGAIDPDVFNYPNAGLSFSYHVDGSYPYTSGDTVIMWRGQFDS